MNLIPSRDTLCRIGALIRQYRNPLIAVAVLVILTLFISGNRGEASRIVAVIQGANPWLLALALLMNVLIVATAGLTYRVVLGRLGHHQPWAWLANLHLKRHVVGTVTPVGGPASIYVFVRSLGNRGVETGDALLAIAIRSVSGYAAFLLILAPAIVLNPPSRYTIAGAVGLFLVLVVLLAGMLLVLRESWNPGWLMRRLHPRALHLVRTSRSHGLRPVDFGKPFGLALVHNGLGVMTLYVSLLAVGHNAALSTAIIGYAIGNLFMMVAPVFQGMGVVELTMAIALQQLGVPVPAAIAATLLFRFCDVWFPLILGVATHAPQVDHVRRVASQMPALTTAVVGIVVLMVPFFPNPMRVDLSIPGMLGPGMALIGGAWCLLIAYALWSRRPVGQISVYGAVVVFTPILLFQAQELLAATL